MLRGTSTCGGHNSSSRAAAMAGRVAVKVREPLLAERLGSACVSYAVVTATQNIPFLLTSPAAAAITADEQRKAACAWLSHHACVFCAQQQIQQPLQPRSFSARQQQHTVGQAAASSTTPPAGKECWQRRSTPHCLCQQQWCMDAISRSVCSTVSRSSAIQLERRTLQACK